MYQFIDFVTKKSVVPKDLVFTGETSPWEIAMDLTWVQKKLNLNYFKMTPPCLAKYLPLMPIKTNSELISLNETATPLIKSKRFGTELSLELYFKMEGKNPTGSFKDRGSALEVSIAREFGAKGIVLASTGNMAASCACYAAAAKIPCFVLVPENVSFTKLAQVTAYGGKIIQVKGNYNDAARFAKTIAREMGFYLAGDYAYRVEGQKTAAFEMVDQLFFHVPDVVIVPIGCGTNITAYFKGFLDYQQLGLINKIPQLIGVQAQGANAVVQSYQQQLRSIKPLTSANTIASAIAVPNPIDGLKALDAIYATKGLAICVTDEEILHAQTKLATEESLFVESAAAATFAALMKLITTKELKNSSVVCILTGDGLKDVNLVLKKSIKPLMIDSDSSLRTLIASI